MSEVGELYEIEHYRLENGKSPVEDFIRGLEKKMQSKALATIDLLAEYGNQLREPYSKSMGDGLFELRIKFSSDISRIFYFFIVDNKIILTNGFIKKTVKTPKTELDLARKYKKDYERRMLHE